MEFPLGEIEGQPLQFYPSARSGGPSAFAVLVVVWLADEVLLADIPGRGWCLPSGRIEAGETPAQAAEREAMEESGAILTHIRQIGHELWGSGKAATCVDVFVAQLSELRPLPDRSESRGRRLVHRRDLPAVYYEWNPLLEAIFDYAHATGREL